MSARYNFNRLAYFVATIDAGTITGAASALGVSKAVVSKQLQLLEEELETALLMRNTRRLQPTEAGLAFYEDAKSALTQANNAYERVQERDKKPKGRLRITAPVDYGISYVAPFVARFQATYPDVSVDLQLTDAQLDIIEERCDLAFRVGWLKDSNNLARKLQDFDEIAVCSPETQSRVQVADPEDLVSLPFIRIHALAGKADWAFRRGKKTQSVRLNPVTEMNITLAIRALILEGFAFSILPDFLLQADLESGRLCRLLPDWSIRSGGVYTVTHPGRVRSNALLRFLEMSHSELGSRT